MTAAFVIQNSTDLAGDDVKRVLSYLAYRVQEQFSEGIIPHGEAMAIVEEFLKGGEGEFFDFQVYEARKYSREVLEVGEITTGLLVEKSPKEIGFYHRVLQEYLTGLYIAAMPFAQQLALVGERCADSQWREVILALFYSTSRQEDIKQFIDRIKETKVTESERYTVEALLSEVAFGDFNCSVGIARELGREALRSIELGDWMPHRERLLRHALEVCVQRRPKRWSKPSSRSGFPGALGGDKAGYSMLWQNGRSCPKSSNVWSGECTTKMRETSDMPRQP